MSGKVLVAGIGNIFLGDDGFGVEVAQRLAGQPATAGVRVVDFGIRGLHLAYELLDGYETAILVDATPRGRPPGTLYVIEPEAETVADSQPFDAHSLNPEAVLATMKTLGGRVDRVLVVGCEPATVEEGIGLSAPVAEAVERAIGLVHELVAEAQALAQARPATQPQEA